MVPPPPPTHFHGAAVALLSSVQQTVAAARDYRARRFRKAAGLSSFQELGELVKATVAEKLRERVAPCPAEERRHFSWPAVSAQTKRSWSLLLFCAT